MLFIHIISFQQSNNVAIFLFLVQVKKYSVYPASRGKSQWLPQCCKHCLQTTLCFTGKRNIIRMLGEQHVHKIKLLWNFLKRHCTTTLANDMRTWFRPADTHVVELYVVLEKCFIMFLCCGVLVLRRLLYFYAYIHVHCSQRHYITVWPSHYIPSLCCCS